MSRTLLNGTLCSTILIGAGLFLQSPGTVSEVSGSIEPKWMTSSFQSPVIGAITPSQGDELDGLVVSAEPTTRTFSTAEPLSFKVTYHNVSTHSLRLPDQPNRSGQWLIQIENVSTHKQYTGGSLNPSGGVPRIAAASAAIPAGGVLTVAITCQYFGFAEGLLSASAFDGAKFAAISAARGIPAGGRGGQYMPVLVPGIYKVAVNVRFPDSTIQDSDPTPVWKHDGFLTRAAEIEIVH